jgi:hypothetical protein
MLLNILLYKTRFVEGAGRQQKTYFLEPGRWLIETRSLLMTVQHALKVMGDEISSQPRQWAGSVVADSAKPQPAYTTHLLPLYCRWIQLHPS